MVDRMKLSQSGHRWKIAAYTENAHTAVLTTKSATVPQAGAAASRIAICAASDSVMGAAVMGGGQT
jgi:hypothetical protein